FLEKFVLEEKSLGAVVHDGFPAQRGLSLHQKVHRIVGPVIHMILGQKSVHTARAGKAHALWVQVTVDDVVQAHFHALWLLPKGRQKVWLQALGHKGPEGSDVRDPEIGKVVSFHEGIQGGGHSPYADVQTTRD